MSAEHPHNNFPKLQNLVADIDARFGSVDGYPSAFTPTREAYITLVVGGEKIEGEPLTMRNGPDEAIDGWAASFLEYMLKAPPYPSRLYWRQRPQVEFDISWDGEGREIEKWTVYSRLLITDKPIMSKDDMHEFHPQMFEWCSDRGFFA